MWPTPTKAMMVCFWSCPQILGAAAMPAKAATLAVRMNWRREKLLLIRLVLCVKSGGHYHWPACVAKNSILAFPRKQGCTTNTDIQKSLLQKRRQLSDL